MKLFSKVRFALLGVFVVTVLVFMGKTSLLRALFLPLLVALYLYGVVKDATV